MPQIAGYNVVGLLAATIAFYFVGFLIFGVVFQREWTLTILSQMDYADKAINISQLSKELLMQEWAKAFPNANSVFSLATGFVSAAVTVTILAIVLRHLTAEAPGLMATWAWTLAIILGFVLATLANGPIYANSPLNLFMMDALHQTVGLLAAATILYFFE